MADDATRLVAERYELGELIGSGGAGAVWRGRDRRLDRTVAIKEVRFPATLDRDEGERRRTRVRREARAAGRLSHPSVTTVYDVVEEDGRAFIVMELVEAPTLADLVRRDGPLAPPRAAQIGAEVLGALRAAHGHGVIHRDVKPSNVLVPPVGPAKLTDFGIAAAVDDPSITGTGAVVGSPAYMAPEQARDGDRTAASDLYSLGATLFFALEGRPPFERSGTIATVTAVVNEPPPVPQRAGPLTDLVSDLLAKDPAERPRAATVAERLEAVAALTAEPTPGTATQVVAPAPTPTPEPARPEEPDPADEEPAAPPPAAAEAERSNRTPILLALAALALLAGFVLWNALGSDDADDGADVAAESTAAPTEADEEDEAPAEEPAPDEAEEEPAQEPPAEDVDDADPPAEDEAAEEPAQDADADVGVGTAPEDWTVHTDDATGYRIAHPPGWEVVTVSDTLTDFRDPDSSTYLRIDWTDAPPSDPVADWQQQSQAFGSGREGYEELRIEPIDWRGFDAALWEYRYTADGIGLRAYNLGIDTGTYGHALNMQAAESDWDDVQDLWETFNRVFEPGGQGG